MRPLALAFAMLSLLTGDAVSVAQDAGQHLKKGKTAFDDFDYKTALSHFGKAISLDPNKAEAYFYRGQVYLLLAQPKDAIADETKTIQLNPKQVDAFITRGNAYFAINETTKALADMDNALALDQKNVEAISGRGRIYLYSGKYKKAIDDYSRLVELDSRDSLAHLQLARILASCDDNQLRNGKKALEYAKKGWKLIDQEHDFLMPEAIAASYAELGQFKDAVEWQKRAINNIPPGQNWHKASAEARLSLFQKKQAIRYKDFKEWLK